MADTTGGVINTYIRDDGPWMNKIPHQLLGWHRRKRRKLRGPGFGAVPSLLTHCLSACVTHIPLKKKSITSSV